MYNYWHSWNTFMVDSCRNSTFNLTNKNVNLDLTNSKYENRVFILNVIDFIGQTLKHTTPTINSVKSFLAWNGL